MSNHHQFSADHAAKIEYLDSICLTGNRFAEVPKATYG
jgi:hypothetical protein